jgi:hypothetical protein
MVVGYTRRRETRLSDMRGTNLVPHRGALMLARAA